MSRKCHGWALLVGCGAPLVCKYLILAIIHINVVALLWRCLSPPRLGAHVPRAGSKDNIRPQLLALSSPFQSANSSHTPTVNCGVRGVKWALFSPLGDADILSSFEDGNPILCYDHSSLFSNLYQNFHLTILLPNGDREEALNRRDIVTGQISIGYSWILARNDDQPHWRPDSGFDKDHVEMHGTGSGSEINSTISFGHLCMVSDCHMAPLGAK